MLRPGGLFAVADMVEIEPLGARDQACGRDVGGLDLGDHPDHEYRAQLEAVGFVEVEIDVHAEHELEGEGRIGSAYIRARRLRA